MYSLIKVNKDNNIQTVEFCADTEADITNLPKLTSKGSNGDNPVPAGSSCFVIGTGKVYMLNHSGVWTAI